MSIKSIVHRSLVSVGLLIAVAALNACGVGGTASTSQWQQQLNHHVWQQHNGDLNFLRDADYAGPHRRFAVLGGPESAKSTDLVGVLAGHTTVEDEPWYVFMLATNTKRVVTELRAAAVTMRDGELVIRMGQADAAALGRYIEARRSGWQGLHADGAEPPAAFTEFPAPTDRFDLAVEGRAAIVREARSGATVRVELAESAEAGP